jgi:hypothetical protein
MILQFDFINDEPKLLKKQKSSIRGRVICKIVESIYDFFIYLFYKKYKISPITN